MSVEPMAWPPPCAWCGGPLPTRPIRHNRKHCSPRCQRAAARDRWRRKYPEKVREYQRRYREQRREDRLGPHGRMRALLKYRARLWEELETVQEVIQDLRERLGTD